MAYAPHYPTPPPYMPFDFHRTPPVSPAPGAHYYSPRYGPPTATPSPRVSPKVSAHHHRRASQACPPPPYPSYQSPRGGAAPQYYPDYASPRYQATPQQQRVPDYVSGGFDYSTRPSRPRRQSDAPPLKRSHRERKHSKSHARCVRTKIFYDDGGYGYEYIYDYPPPPYEPYPRHDTYGVADGYYSGQVPIYADAEPKASRPRRASHASRPQPAPPKRPTTKKSPQATEEDARRAGIPAGYSYKNWDPTEEPILLLGSVFDANSLGKWIYDWTVFYHGPGSPFAEMAGELWLLLIQLAGKVKRAEEIMPKIRKQEGRELVEDFLESGERLWIRFAKLLKVCEEYMWKAAKKENGDKKPVSMGKNSGCEFVDSIFGRDRELEKTEKLMTGMRLWSMRFDANCEEYLRHPSA
ncbi:uncharacterized protein EI97DRAFT_46367 [Westerdykella ornata]|uniref:Vegetative cell wall protein gp1 n=1 Tax=Westerdykella ornata TaxID=318751 RepID=A0A6A6JIG8_WESOR|nr:uncharacterized protein EI97DRAFT_46367 [Westerdykella ornata]KAF2276035.1 hypothetical protein EI97DRAFT_46367 [Westerdykella ornata]